MPDTLPVTIDVEPAAAAVLNDPGARAAVGRLISRVLIPHPGQSDLAQAIGAAKAEARAGNLTDSDIDAELEAYNVEHRGSPAA